ncbi:MAG TPA: hypothetical protein VGT61_14495 [Thermomicrobiales bacterium]|jgi:hypothetical protein|nr:hypothetical protein [Thermomicrobiales bacterium]
MPEVVVSLFLLAALGLSGFVALARARLGLTRLELVAYGFPVGMITWSLVALGIACLLGQLSLALILGLCMASLATAIVLYVSGTGPDGPWPGGIGLQDRFLPRPSGRVGFVHGPSIAPTMARDDETDLGLWQGIRRLVGWTWFWPVVVVGAFFIRWVFLWGGMFDLREDGLFPGQINVWGDWPQHVGDAASFIYGNNFPPEHPRMAGVPYAYHYLSSLTGAMFIRFGMTPYDALALHSFVLSAFIALGVLAFALRLLRDARTAALAVLLFLLGGGFGWVLIAQLGNENGDILGTIWNQPWNIYPQKDNGFWWENFYLSNIEPQRSTLYGIPLSLLILTLLYQAVQRFQPRHFVAAGVVIGLMPFSHLGALPALAIVIAMVALLFPSGRLGGPIGQWYPARKWIAFGVIAAGLAVPQLILQQAGQPAVTGGVAFHWGWLKGENEPIWWFWLKNLGWFAPLLLIGLALPRMFGSHAYRFLLAFMPIFLVCNVLKLQIDPLDNIKTLLYWHLAVCLIAAAVIARGWRLDRTIAARVLILLVVSSMFFSGLLVNLQQARGLDTYRWESATDLEIAELVREQTLPRGVFATAPRLDHPISTLTGRPVVMSFQGWLFTRGFDTAPRREALEDIYSLEPNTEALFDEYGIDYVVIGWTEREDYEPDLEDWRERYPIAIETDDYLIFAVSDPAIRRMEQERERQALLAGDSPSQRPSDVPTRGPRQTPTAEESYRPTIIYPAGQTPGAGTPVGGTPITGSPMAGTPIAGTPPVAAPSSGVTIIYPSSRGTPAAASAGTPASGTPGTGTPASGIPGTGTPAATPIAAQTPTAVATQAPTVEPTPRPTRPPR